MRGRGAGGSVGQPCCGVGAGGSVGQHCEGEGCWWVSRSVL